MTIDEIKNLFPQPMRIIPTTVEKGTQLLNGETVLDGEGNELTMSENDLVCVPDDEDTRINALEEQIAGIQSDYEWREQWDSSCVAIALYMPVMGMSTILSCVRLIDDDTAHGSIYFGGLTKLCFGINQNYSDKSVFTITPLYKETIDVTNGTITITQLVAGADYPDSGPTIVFLVKKF